MHNYYQLPKNDLKVNRKNRPKIRTLRRI
uniref:Uncharacterized protein n=1 Tax=Arundo donax TaxID=35708 RepID=A0A0A9AC48_ARUDO